MANTATSMYFNGSDAYIRIPSTDMKKIVGYGATPTNTWLGNNSWTIEAWVYHDGDFTNQDATYKENSWFEWGDVYLCGLVEYVTTTTARPTLYYYNSSNSGVYVQGQASAEYYVNKQQWHHLAVSTEPSGVKVYLDGILIGFSSTSLTISSNFNDGTAYFYIGGKHNSSYADWNGYIDEFRFSTAPRYGNFKATTVPLDVKQTASVGMNTLKPENVTVLLQSDNSVANGTSIIGKTSNKGSGGGTIANHNGSSKIVTTESLPWKNTSFLINGKVDRWYLGTGTDPSPFASFGYDDFSIEGWFKIPTGTAAPGYNMPLRVTHNGGPSSNWYINIASVTTSGAA